MQHHTVSEFFYEFSVKRELYHGIRRWYICVRFLSTLVILN